MNKEREQGDLLHREKQQYTQSIIPEIQNDRGELKTNNLDINAMINRHFIIISGVIYKSNNPSIQDISSFFYLVQTAQPYYGRNGVKLEQILNWRRLKSLYRTCRVGNLQGRAASRQNSIKHFQIFLPQNYLEYLRMP